MYVNTSEVCMHTNMPNIRVMLNTVLVLTYLYSEEGYGVVVEAPTIPSGIRQ